MTGASLFIEGIGFLDEQREQVLLYLRTTDPTYYMEENVHHAANAFVVNSVVKWCVAMVDEGRMSRGEAEELTTSVKDYIEGRIDYYWGEDGHLYIENIE